MGGITRYGFQRFLIVWYRDTGMLVDREDVCLGSPVDEQPYSAAQHSADCHHCQPRRQARQGMKKDRKSVV